MKQQATPASNPLSAPRVFISYTHENSKHKTWVRKLATDLRNNGVDAILDQWECKYGSELKLFMERGIRRADRVLLVCTPQYKKKADTGKGGVGYERLVVTAELAKRIATHKFICVLRAESMEKSIPIFADGRLHQDFREDSEYALRLEELLRDIHQSPAEPKPPLGPNPFCSEVPTIQLQAESLATDSKPSIGPNPYDVRDQEQKEIEIKRRLMPETRMAITHKFDIAGHEGYLHVGLYEDGAPGELFITMAKEGSTIGGLMDCFGTAVTMSLQYGVPIDVLIKRFAHVRFEPSGMTKDPDIQYASSIVDYIFRWLGCQFLPGFREAINPVKMPKELKEEVKKLVNRSGQEMARTDNSPTAPPASQ